MASKLSPQERKLLDGILDVLIPQNPTRGIPGAGELGVADFLIECAAKDESFDVAIRMLLERASDGNIEDVRRIETEASDAFARLLEQSYKGYYSRADIRAKFGVGAHPPHPEGYKVAPEPPELMETLTAPVRVRGQAYRDTPAGDKNAE